MANWLQKGAAYFDSWASATLGLGGSKDAQWVPDCGVPLNPQAAMTLYHQNDLARLLSEVPVDFGTRNGWCISGLDEEVRRLSIKSKLADAAAFGRACGGGALYLTINDGQDPSSPAGPKVKGLSNVMVLDRRSITVRTRNQDTRSERYGEPELFDVTPPAGGFMQQVHASRLVLLGGDRTAPQERYANGDWDYSVLDRAYPILQMYGLSWESASQLLNTMSQAVYGVDDLSGILTSDKGEETLLRRMSMIQRARSTARAMVRDAKNETFEILNTSLGGLPELMDRFAVRLAAAYRIPVTVLFGQAPAGLNATGASDLQIFWASVRSWQQDTLYPALYRIAKILAPEREPEITIEDPDPLWKERQAELWLKRGQTDVLYINSEVYTAAEVTKERQDYIQVNPLTRELFSETDKAEDTGSADRAAGEGVGASSEDEPARATADSES